MDPHQIAELWEMVLIIGGCALLAYSPIMRGLADRLRYGKQLPPGAAASDREAERVDDISAEVSALRQRLDEAQERIDFTERLLAQARSQSALPPGSGPR